MNHSAIRVLLVEDSPTDALLLHELLVREQANEFVLTCVERLADALIRVRQESYDLLLLDLTLHDSEGLDTFRKLSAAAPDVPVVVVTSVDDGTTGVRAVQEGAQDFLIKGQLDGHQIVRTLRYALERKRTQLTLQRSERELRVFARQQAAVAQLGQLALTDIDLQVLMNRAVQLASQTLDVEFGLVLERLPGGRQGLLRAGIGWQDNLVGKASVIAGMDSLEDYTLRSSEPVIVADLRAETRFNGSPLLHNHYVISGVSVIIGQPDRPYGILGAHTTHRREFSQDDVHFLQAVANVLSALIERKQAEAAEREQRILAEALGDIAAALNSVLDVEEVLDRILTYVARVLPYNSASIALIEGNEVVLTRCKGFPDDECERVLAMRFLIAEASSYVNMLATKLPFVMSNTDDDPHWVHLPNMPRIRSYIGVPVRTGEDVIGFLTLDSGTPGAFNASHVGRLQAFADQASVAVHNARLFEQLRSLTRQVVSIQEEERRRLSRELHDEAGQALIALKWSLSSIQQNAPQDLRSRLSDAMNLAEMTMEHIRLLAQNLRPSALDTLGINLALEGYCRDFTRRAHLSIDYTGCDLPDLPDSMSTCLYRFLQEAITNAAKHSRATHIQVKLQREDAVIRLSVQDNGLGFDVTASMARGKKGIGLIGMQERLRLLDGWLNIESSPGSGSLICACLPWEEAP
jgi:signal transduction histidine kinase/CheY-like chemotaxis protein